MRLKVVLIAARMAAGDLHIDCKKWILYPKNYTFREIDMGVLVGGLWRKRAEYARASAQYASTLSNDG